MAKITFNPPFKDYYNELPIKPGMPFFRALIAATKYPLAKLRIKIPETLMQDLDGKYMWLSSTQTGINVKTKFSITEFLMALEG